MERDRNSSTKSTLAKIPLGTLPLNADYVLVVRRWWWRCSFLLRFTLSRFGMRLLDRQTGDFLDPPLIRRRGEGWYWITPWYIEVRSWFEHWGKAFKNGPKLSLLRRRQLLLTAIIDKPVCDVAWLEIKLFSRRCLVLLVFGLFLWEG